MGIWWDVTIIRWGWKPWNHEINHPAIFVVHPWLWKPSHHLTSLKHALNIVVPIIVIMNIMHCRTCSTSSPAFTGIAQQFYCTNGLECVLNVNGNGFSEKDRLILDDLTKEKLGHLPYLLCKCIYVYMEIDGIIIHVRYFNCGVIWHLFIDTPDNTPSMSWTWIKTWQFKGSRTLVLIYWAFIGQSCGTENSTAPDLVTLYHVCFRILSQQRFHNKTMFWLSKSWLFCGDAPKQKPSESWN